MANDIRTLLELQTCCDSLSNEIEDILIYNTRTLSKESLAEKMGNIIGVYQRLNISGFFSTEHMKTVSNKILEVESGSSL